MQSEARSRLELIAGYLFVGRHAHAARPQPFLELAAPVKRAIHARLQHNHATLSSCSSVASRRVSLLDVEGGFYATLRLPHVQSEEAWVLELLERDSVYVQPGLFFDFRDEAYWC